ncbi:hypothetical protein [Legionella drancourtii]|uniref:Uncharacterized protein n=1 Tax=Legionella drancourtii LLAP12 TaxID=658187 RepID=G9EK82_9GAMM|nr:hypothetical protein [Legionella drancourtii]EHL32233.1 hypothetical protein LDG_5606 [Legionella drancourtii LLAP12]
MYPPVSYDSLFHFIQKNKAIHKAIAKVDREQVKQLAEAIKEGHYQAEIFNDTNCYLYLLFLLKEKTISFEQGMTVYSYLLALAQFTEQQPLRPEDQDVKTLRQISVERLANQQELTAEGRAFLECILKQMEEMHYHLDFAEIEAFILQGPPSEHLLLGVPYFLNRKSQIESLARALAQNIPFLGTTKSADDTLWLPSYSLINFLLRKMSTKPMQMYPVFGSVNNTTLRNLHLQSYHPVSLYAVSVLSNPHNADGYRCGCFLMWLHDIGHIFWASLLTEEERYYALVKIPKRLENLAAHTTYEDKEKVNQRIQQAIETAADFNLTNIKDYANPQYRFSTYISKQVMNNGLRVYGFCQVEFKPIGCLEDHLYYWITKLTHANKNDISWELISNGLKTGEFYRQQQITNALYNLATSSFNSRYMKIDWQAWLELLDSSIDSKTLWDKAVKEQQSQLLHLIATGKLEFFHPYLPMTAEKHIQFRDYVVEQSKLAPQTQNSYNSLFSTSRPQRENKRGSSLTFFSRDLFFSPSEDKPPIDSTPAKTNIAKPGDRP